ncbi:hypothetical protein DL769_010740 [Monosporascus sp. CRB-8-3]|nr:hypothetical protein DL769_010740 [Monosporascus sp. CRB-8-3]
MSILPRSFRRVVTVIETVPLVPPLGSTAAAPPPPAAATVIVGSFQPAAPTSASAPAVAQAPSVGGALADMPQDSALKNVNRAHCNSLAEPCVNKTPKTDIRQTDFVCLEDQPSTIKLIPVPPYRQLLCAK